MKRTIPLTGDGPSVLRIPSGTARTTEAALERAHRDATRAFDVWVHRVERLDDALDIRRRLDEDRSTRGIALVALVKEMDRLAPDAAAALSARAAAGRIAAVFPASGHVERVEDLLLDLLDQQRTASRHRDVRKERRDLEADAGHMRAVEKSLAHKLYAPLVALTGTDLSALEPLDKTLKACERLCLTRALGFLNGDVAATRRVLKLTRSRFYRLLHEHELHHLVRRHEPGNDSEEERE
jgi:hypothetical protein